VPHAPAHLRAFTLLELLAVLIVLAAMVGLVAPALVRASARESERRQAAELVSWLSLERVEAMRRSIVVEVDLAQGDQVFAAIGPSGERVWSGWRLVLVDESGEPLDESRVYFDALGRTTTRTLWLQSAQESDRIWRVEFDPISGRPFLRSGGDGANMEDP